jgi:hypothetical protein
MGVARASHPSATPSAFLLPKVAIPVERTGTSPVFAQRTRLKVLASTPGIAFGLSCTSARGCGVPNQC